MTQKLVKQRLVEAYNTDTLNEMAGETTYFANDILVAIENLYVGGIVSLNFYKAISDFYYDGEMEKQAFEKEPMLYRKLSIKRGEAV